MEGAPKIPSPPGYDRAYAQSYELAFDRLTHSNLNMICRVNGASLITDGIIGLEYFGNPITVDSLHRTVNSVNIPLTITEKLIILHYLVTAGGKTATGKLITFKELPEGAGYFPTFYKRAVAPVISKFGNSIANLRVAAAAIGGTAIDMGDAAVSFGVLPHVVLVWIIWRGDSVLPPEGSVVFDSTITDYLPVEDIAALCQSIAGKLCG